MCSIARYQQKIEAPVRGEKRLQRPQNHWVLIGDGDVDRKDGLQSPGRPRLMSEARIHSA
jgi:hypothetical protein